MITKTVIKDFVEKRCPYLVSLELEDKTLISLFKQYVDLKEKYRELLSIEQEESGDTSDNGFDLYEALRDYPHLRKQINKYRLSSKKNAVEELVEKYVDNQLISKLSRQYFINKFGEDKCVRCDVDMEEKDIVNQSFIVSITNQYLKDPRIKVIFEGQLEYEDLRARFDVLIKNDDGTFNIIEVKGTNDVYAHPTSHGETDYSFDTGIKDKYLYDLLFQYLVYDKAGLKIKSLGFMYTNRDFALKELTYPVSKNELDDLFILKDLINLKSGTISVKEYLDSGEYIYNAKNEPVRLRIEYIIDQIHEIAKLSEVKPEKKYLCRRGPACPFMDTCFKDASEPNSIFKLSNWGSFGGHYGRMERLILDKVYKISDIVPEDYGYSEFKKSGDRSNAYTQIRFQKKELKQKYLIDKTIMNRVIKQDYLNDQVDYLLFFDFESFQYPIPLVEYLTPWKQVVSQYSMHVVKKGYDLTKHDFEKGKGGDVTHFEYIANPDDTGYANPSIPLYETLKKQLESVGIDPYASNYKVVVFNKNFEDTRMKEFVEDFTGIVDPELTRFVANFKHNIVDLLDFFTSGAMYSIDFNGRGSLKVVQPSLAADPNVINFYKKLPFDFTYSLDYHKGDKCLVYNGSICLDLYKALLIRSHLNESSKGPSTTSLLAEALAYCKIDSWGTVIIYDVIKNVYLGHLKLDALIV